MKVIKNKKYACFSVAILFAGTLSFLCPPHFDATQAKDVTGTDKAESDLEFAVNVEETLNMTVTAPVDPAGSQGQWAQGDVNKFLRNKVSVSVSSNNGSGFTAGMTTKETNTALTNQDASSHTIPTLSSSTSPRCANSDCEAFPTNFWGYSLDDDSNTGTYKALVGSDQKPITVISNASGAATKSEDVYFGAKADSTKASGTYKNTVVFTVTSGTSGSELPSQGPAADPTVPSGPSAEPNIPSNAPSADSASYAYTTSGRTYHSYAASTPSGDEVAMMDDETTKKQSSAKDYVEPLGVVERHSTNIQNGSIITMVLLISALFAAFSGFFLFILAKRRKDDDEEQDIQ